VAKKPETVYKERVRAFLRELPGCWFVKVQQVCLRGVPDFLVCISGKFVAIELKKDLKSQPDALQVVILGKIKRAGGITILSCPETWEEDKNLLRSLAA